MESPPKRVRKELPIDYKNMSPDEFALNMLYEFLKTRNKEPEAWKRAKHIQNIRKKRLKYEAKELETAGEADKLKQKLEAKEGITFWDIIRSPILAQRDNFVYREKLKEAGKIIGTTPMSKEEARVLITDEEKTTLKAIGILLFSWPIAKIANQYPKQKEAAKKTLKEPFSAKTIGDIFKNFGKEATKL
ncbi:MAG: hypothetical protein HYT37_01205 [Candidatus Sungbacteria bacterium]|nr:hypothetical protein [Candidatus Sungbacteria bacterium]